MQYNDRERYAPRYDEEDRHDQALDRGRYESGRFGREPSRPEHNVRDYDYTSGEHDEFSRNPYRLRDFDVSGSRGSRKSAILVRLSDTDIEISDRDDLRGRTLIDQHGNDLGDVNDLIVDRDRREVRFLLATSGGFLGIGGTMLLVPVQAIGRVTNKVVAIDRSYSRGFRSNVYNPTLIDHRQEQENYRGYNKGFSDYERAFQHRGRGPRNYRRSDERIKEDINDRLSDRGDLDASEIDVRVNNCEVTLEGTVNSRRDKRLAEDIAESVSGVQNVENRLKTNRLGLGTSTDRYDVVTPPSSRETNVETTPEASRQKSTGR